MECDLIVVKEIESTGSVNNFTRCLPFNMKKTIHNNYLIDKQ